MEQVAIKDFLKNRLKSRFSAACHLTVFTETNGFEQKYYRPNA